MVLLKFHQHLTYLKPDSWKVTVTLHKLCDKKYKFLTTLPKGALKIYSPNSNFCMNIHY
jgi:predicted Zn-dependent protease